jgi:hypothetical protein
MGRFKNWHENPIQFVMWSRDGRIVVAINGKRYTYATDALYHDELKKLAKYKPGAALAKLKEWVKRGWAQQIDPPPDPSPPQQLTLF